MDYVDRLVYSSVSIPRTNHHPIGEIVFSRTCHDKIKILLF